MKPSSQDNGDDSSSVDSHRFDTTGPQFRAPTKASSKVVLDERFSAVLTDERFQLQVHDKYGRKTKKKKNAKEDLSAFYTVAEPSGGHNDKPSGHQNDKSSKSSKHKPNKKKREESDSDEDDKPGSASRIAYLTALSRGQLDISSSSSDDESSDEAHSSSSDEESDVESRTGREEGGILDPSRKEEEVEITYEQTRILAVTNLDWTHVRALDIYALISSFVPPGALRRVRVFVSDFGQEKLASLERFGPTGVWKTTSSKNKDGADSEEEETGSDSESLKSDDSRCHGGNGDLEAEEDDEYDDDNGGPLTASSEKVESDFDQEKLRAYEASKLRYYFAVAEFDSPESAEKAYREVDGMEFEHSSAEVDLRAIPEVKLESVIKNRPLRDEASTLPSNYSPPEFIVSALQQTNVQCTWDLTDQERERTLTKYNSGEQWRALAESDDLKAYIGSDVSSDEEEDGRKAMMLRKSLGLGSDSEDDVRSIGRGNDEDSIAPDDDGSMFSGDGDDAGDSDDGDKEFTFVPGSSGKADLVEKIQEKLSGSAKPAEALTPWEKYKEKRKQKRQERRQAARGKRNDAERGDRTPTDSDADEAVDPNNKAALELLVAGEEGDELHMDYDIRELQRLEKMKGKTLKGSRKRKELERAETVAGTAFDVDVTDTRFQAVLDGSDERFGIDQTDSNFRKTPGMLKILKEQTQRRKKKRANSAMSNPVPPNVSSESAGLGTGAKALSALVQSLKAKHN